jgi:hypothetical protein
MKRLIIAVPDVHGRSRPCIPKSPEVLSERERAVSLFFGRRTALHQVRKFISAKARGRLKFDLGATRTTRKLHGAVTFLNTSIDES